MVLWALNIDTICVVRAVLTKFLTRYISSTISTDALNTKTFLPISADFFVLDIADFFLQRVQYNTCAFTYIEMYNLIAITVTCSAWLN